MSETEHIGIETLTELALNLRWSWNRSTDELWAELDPELWALTQNPWAVLQTVSPRRARALLARPDYRQRVKDLIERRHQYLGAPGWFQEAHSRQGRARVRLLKPAGRAEILTPPLDQVLDPPPVVRSVQERPDPAR